MTAEKLHDALTLLPADLIAAADKLRTQPRRKVIHWARWASLAACLAVVLLGGWLFSSGLFSAFGADKAAPMEITAEDAAACEKAYSGSGWEEPHGEEAGENILQDVPAAQTTAAASTRELASQSVETPCAADSAACYSSDPRITLICSNAELEEYFSHYAYRYDFEAMQESCTDFDDDWFSTHDLLLIALHAIPADQVCEVTSITQRDGIWDVCIANSRNSSDGACTDRHILLGIEKDEIPDADSIHLIFE